MIIKDNQVFLFIIVFITVIQNAKSEVQHSLNSVNNYQLSWDYDDDLQKLFDKFFQKVITVIKENDPFNYPKFEFNQDSYGLTCKGFLKDLSLSLLSTISLVKLKVTENPVHFELGLGFTELQLVGNYNLNFDFLTMFPLFGDGDIGAAATNINVTVYLDVETEGKGNIMQLSTLNLNTTIQTIKVDLDSILDNPALGKFLSNIISDISPDILMILEKVVKMSEGFIKRFINSYLLQNGITFEKVIDIVKQFVQ